ncbi:hypothetical protein HY857_01455 [Candidatus Saccharibacteria bacterium]|nr:hypothetical protein [Candidatus Saccharibacteria bacterium]
MSSHEELPELPPEERARSEAEFAEVAEGHVPLTGDQQFLDSWLRLTIDRSGITPEKLEALRRSGGVGRILRRSLEERDDRPRLF